MADATEPKGRYPRQEVAEGQKHGYIGEVEVYDPPHAEAGYSNADTAPAGGNRSTGSDSSSTGSRSSSSSRSRSTTTRQTAKDVTPAAKPVAGTTGVVGGPDDDSSKK